MKHFDKEKILKSVSADVFLWVLPAVLIIPNIILDITDYSNWLVKLSNVLFPAGVYMILAGLSRNVGRTALFMFPLIFYAAFQVVLLYLYGESIIAVDMFLNLVTTNVGEATELLGNMSLAVITVIVLYLLPLVWAIWLVCVGDKADVQQIRNCRRWGWYVAAAGVLAIVAAYVFVPRFALSRNVFPVNVICNTVTAAQRTAATTRYFHTSAAFDSEAVSSRPRELKEVYVLVIGETSRADNWQLGGYARPTNPRLSQRDSLLFFNKALSQSNTTHKSVPLLLTNLTVETFGDSIFTTKSMISAFNQAGFRTAYLTNQARNHSFIDFFAREAQVTDFIRDDGNPHYDGELLPLLEKFIDESPAGKMFVVLHTYGSHFNYKDRYPKEYEHFMPDLSTSANKGNRLQLMNAYDNSIRYTDAVLDSVIGILDRQNCVAAMMYLSDHGEDIFDDRRGRFLHASPVPTYYQIHVPVIMWASGEYHELAPEVYDVAKSHLHGNVASNEVVYDTMLELAGITTAYSDPQKSLVNRRYTDRPRRYLNDYNEAVPLEAAGLRSYDIERLDSAAILHN